VAIAVPVMPSSPSFATTIARSASEPVVFWSAAECSSCFVFKAVISASAFATAS
jgi:hypothetical protein